MPLIATRPKRREATRAARAAMDNGPKGVTRSAISPRVLEQRFGVSGKSRSWVIQKYIEKPFLIHKRPPGRRD